MARADEKLQTTSSQAGAAYVPRGRDRLARLVVVGSFLTLFLLVGTLIFLAQSDNQTASEAAKSAFTAVLPVLAGWVGTVLAFYFSAASQERTSETLDKAIGRAGAVPGAGAPVTSKMISYSTITGIIDVDQDKPSGINISDLKKKFEDKLPNGSNVTRLIFVEKGIFKYILHVSTLNAFIVKPDNVEKTTFAQMLADEETLRQISKLVVFVSGTATLGDAKAALDKVNGAQDIIVTSSGNSTESMLGWLSNVDLIKALQVN